MSRSSHIVVAAGPRAVERRLLDEIARVLPPGEIAAPPVVVVVPSRSLRLHLLGRLAEERAAWLGLEVVTLAGVAAAILARTGGAPRSGDALIPLLVARRAAREGALAAALGGLVGGWAQIEGAVHDLLDAGFESAHLEAIDERLELERATAGVAAVGRAAAVARVAARVRDELDRLGLAADSTRLTEAARRLGVAPEAALPARRVFIHGFADATGVATDLLEAIVRHRPTLVLFDSPPELDGRTANWRFGARLRDRLSGVALAEHEPREPPAPSVIFHHVADPVREARAAVAWLTPRASPRPERSALVARDSGGLALWAREIDRQALAASASDGASGPRARRAAGLVELLEQRAETPIGVVLELARERLQADSGLPNGDLRLAFAASGARRLSTAAALAPGESQVRLPLADRLGADDRGHVRSLRREVDAARLLGAAARLRCILEAVEKLARPATLGALVDASRKALAEILPDDEVDSFIEPIAGFAAAPFAALDADAEEWRALLAAAWRDLGTEPLGAGGGVALLSVTEARGRTFDRLALTGLTRDRFPRSIRPDPVLSDGLRIRLRELLPDLPVKAEGHDEERFLFAQLLASAEEIVLLRPLADASGRDVAPSPLADEYRRRGGWSETPAPMSSPAALDRAIEAALSGHRAQLAGALPAAIEDAAERAGDGPVEAPERLADARLALLAARDPQPSNPEARRLGAYLGTVGGGGSNDWRAQPPSVTALERFAGCGWRALLERILRLAPIPELGEALPALPRRLTGNVVHDVLERVSGGRRATIDDALALAPTASSWPGPDDLDQETRSAARRVLLAEALDPELFEAPLAREAAARLAVAGETDWSSGRREILAVEADGEARVDGDGPPRHVPFRVDRLERVDGEIWLTDYKTGRPLSAAVTESTRGHHLMQRLARGEALQLAIYLLGVAPAEARARYLQLDPQLDPRARELALTSSELAGTPLAAVLRILHEAWNRGAFVPRLLEPDARTTYQACASCDLREACSQGDSGARMRMAAWAEAHDEAARGIERAARTWWTLRRGVEPATPTPEATPP